jgi:serpin B
MTIFMPAQGTSLPDLTRADWIQTVSQPQQFRPYALTFPRFDFGDSHELNDILKKMGMSEAFDKNKAEFTRMTDCQTFISKVLQLSKISVDEAGTEAAAVTIIGMDTEGMEDPDPINYEPFRIDQPFYFTIENRKEKAVLFVGRVATLQGEPFTPEPADVNSDNTVDISDIVAVINVIAGTDSNSKADVNADGKTDISDIVAVINNIAK